MTREASPRSADELHAWLRLSHTNGIGPTRGRLLLQRLGPPEAILEAGVGAVADILQSPALARALFEPEPARDAAVAGALEWLRAGAGAAAWDSPEGRRSVLPIDDPAYPPRLLDLADPPLVLYCVGDPGSLGRRQVGIVGSRNATALGARTAYDLAAALSAAGWAVVSGMAEGIDRAAHEGALTTGAGGTVAALGTGIDRIYPSRHRPLARRIAAVGALLSEQPIGMPPLPANFPRRNRLIAALANGVLVVEANLKSGSLITARLAADLGREVLAVPGSVHSPLARGCNLLLRQGAKLVETASDVLEELPDDCQLGLRLPSASGWSRSPPGTTPPVGFGVELGADPLPEEQARMLASMSADPVRLETLADRHHLPIAQALAALQTLELGGLVQRQVDGCYVRAS